MSDTPSNRSGSGSAPPSGPKSRHPRIPSLLGGRRRAQGCPRRATHAALIEHARTGRQSPLAEIAHAGRQNRRHKTCVCPRHAPPLSRLATSPESTVTPTAAFIMPSRLALAIRAPAPRPALAHKRHTQTSATSANEAPRTPPYRLRRFLLLRSHSSTPRSSHCTPVLALVPFVSVSCHPMHVCARALTLFTNNGRRPCDSIGCSQRRRCVLPVFRIP